MIKVIAFDFAEVIAEGPMSKWVRENLHHDKNKLLEYKKMAHQWDIGKMTLEEVYKFLGEITGIAPDKIWKEFYLKSKPDYKVIDLIKRLKNNYKIVIFSNYISEQLRKLLVHYKIDDLFDEVIISSEHGIKKPDSKFFEILVKKTKVNKNEIIFTDDKPENIEAANAFGIKSFVFTNTENLIKDLQKEDIHLE